MSEAEDTERGERSDTTSQTTPPAVPLLRRLLPRLLPWASLLIGVVSAVFSRRTPERAPLIVAIAAGGWVVVVVAAVALRRWQGVDRRGRAVRFLAVAASQFVLQSLLAFPVPFFARALSVQHVPFVVVYVVVVVIAFWDPLYRRVAESTPGVVALQGFAAFVSLLTVLPVLGLDNARTFVVAGVVVAVGVPLLLIVSGSASPSRRGFSGVAGLACIVVVGVVLVGAPLVPPAPLSLARASLAAAVVDKEPVDVKAVFAPGAVVFCHTAISAPLGLKDKLVHVWSVDGRMIQTVPLEVSGGRGQGFRTWSRLAAAPRGRLHCQVETALGQVVGGVDAVVSGKQSVGVPPTG